MEDLVEQEDFTDYGRCKNCEYYNDRWCGMKSHIFGRVTPESHCIDWTRRGVNLIPIVGKVLI